MHQTPLHQPGRFSSPGYPGGLIIERFAPNMASTVIEKHFRIAFYRQTCSQTSGNEATDLSFVVVVSHVMMQDTGGRGRGFSDRHENACATRDLFPGRKIPAALSIQTSWQR